MFESMLKWLLIIWGAFFVFEFTYAHADFKTSSPIERIKVLYQSESARIGKKDPDPKLTQSRLEEAAKGITNEEIDWLADQALAAKESGDFRIFSVYVLALNSGDYSVQKLRNIGMSDVTKNSAISRDVREQAIKGLGKSKNPKAREALLEIETEQKDAALQDRAHQALYEFEMGRPEPKPILKSHPKK